MNKTEKTICSWMVLFGGVITLSSLLMLPGCNRTESAPKEIEAIDRFWVETATRNPFAGPSIYLITDRKTGAQYLTSRDGGFIKL